jgi:hypothetical protein
VAAALAKGLLPGGAFAGLERQGLRWAQRRPGMRL